MSLFTLANLDTTAFRSHSMRVGGATQAHINGLSNEKIAKHGFWQDLFSMHGYLQPSDDQLLKVSRSKPGSLNIKMSTEKSSK